METIIHHPVIVVEEDNQVIGVRLGLHVIEQNQNDRANIAPVVLIREDIGKRVVGEGIPRDFHLAHDLIKKGGAHIILRWSKPGDDLLLRCDAWLDLIDLLLRELRSFVVSPDDTAQEKKRKGQDPSPFDEKVHGSFHGKIPSLNKSFSFYTNRLNFQTFI
jgi:hypothetical protein